MESRKLFRMKHEPCSGRCYAGHEVLGLRGLGLDVERTAQLLADLVEVHEPACGREQIGFALDYAEHVGVYVAVFQHFGAVETYVARDPVMALRMLIEGARAWYASEAGRALLDAHPGDGKDACEHGRDDDLVEFALRYSGLDATEQDHVRERVAARLAA